MDNPKPYKSEPTAEEPWNKSSKRYNKKKSPYKDKSDHTKQKDFAYPKKIGEYSQEEVDAKTGIISFSPPEVLEPIMPTNNQDIMEIFKSAEIKTEPTTIPPETGSKKAEEEIAKTVEALPSTASISNIICIEKEQLLKMFTKIEEIESLLRIKKEELKDIYCADSLPPENNKEFTLPLDVAIIEYKKNTTRVMGGNRGGRGYNNRPREPESIPEWSLEKNSEKGENCDKLFTLESMDADNQKIEEEKRNNKKKAKEKEGIPAKIEELANQIENKLEIKPDSAEYNQPVKKTKMLEELFHQYSFEQPKKSVNAKDIYEIEQSLIKEREQKDVWEDPHSERPEDQGNWGISKEALIATSKDQFHIPKPIKPETNNEPQASMQPIASNQNGNPFIIPSRAVNEVDRVWYYIDPQGKTQGPFSGLEMGKWFTSGYFKKDLPVAFYQPKNFFPLGDLLDGNTKPIDEQVKLNFFHDKMNYPLQGVPPKQEYTSNSLKTLEELETGKYAMPPPFNYMMKPFNNQPISNIFSRPQPQYPSYLPPQHNYPQQLHHQYMGPATNPEMLYMNDRMMGMMGNKDMGSK